VSEAIEDHGIIGDLRTVALVSRTGTIDFCCWPRFDSPSIFAALLGDVEAGAFELTPALDEAVHRQLYLYDTNVLLTRSLSPQGIAEVSDFMAIGDADAGQRLLRRAKAVRKRVRFRMRCAPRFDYGRASHDSVEDTGTIVFRSLGADGVRLRLRASVPLRLEDGAAVADFELDAGASATFVLESAELGEASIARDAEYVPNAFKATCDFWRTWAAKSTYRGRWQETVRRSALALKLLTSTQHGSMVAAATFGLPEIVGGGRNWDYRYTWIRDAAFTVYAFLRLGYSAEADAFMGWLRARAAENDDADGRKQVMYRVDGGTYLDETVLPHLAGYRKSVPVRIGNAASEQLQLDTYGEVLDAIYLADKYGEQVSYDAWQGITRTVDWVAAHWTEPDEGIWEVRGGRRSFLIHG